MRIPSEIEYVLLRLEACGHEAYLVGGCVRDDLRGQTPDDFDVTTSALPDETERAFAGDRVIETGLKHGTVTVLHGGFPVEITTYRTEGTYSDGRHPDSVSFTRSLAEDLRRRDFTVNAMAMDVRGRVVDLCGGREDLATKRLRAVGDPATRFTEDALRILRAFRFAAKLGFSIEPATLAAAVSLAPRLRLVSRERVFAELTKLICAPYAQAALTLMADGGVFDCLFDAPQINRRALSYMHSLPARADIRMAALFYGDPGAELHVASLKPPAALLRRVKGILRAAPPTADMPSLRRFVYANGADAARDAALVLAAEQAAQAELPMRLDALLAREDCFALCDLQVNGDDARAAGFFGSAIGRALEAVLFAVFDGKIDNSRPAELEFLLSLGTKAVDTESKV